MSEEIINSLKTDWQPTDFYNYEDLNRVEEATLVVRDKIATFRGELVSLNPTNSARDGSTIEFADSLNRIEENILRLKQTFKNADIFHPSKIDWTHDEPFDFYDAIRFEKDLYDMYFTIENNIANIPYCGELYTGEKGVV